MTREPFPWRLWLLTHGTALAALATGRLIVGGWLLALPFAPVIAIPFDVLILVEWLGGGIRGGEFLPGRPPRVVRVVIVCLWVLVPILTVLARHYQRGESLGHLFIVGTLGLLVCGGTVGLRLWWRPPGRAKSTKGRCGPPTLCDRTGVQTSRVALSSTLIEECAGPSRKT